MSKKVSSVSKLLSSYTLKAIGAERLGYLPIFSFGMEGVPFRFELLDRGQDAVFVLPVDWERRVLYLVQQPRPIKAVSCAEGRKILAAVVANPGVSLSLEVQGANIHTIDVPAGMIDGEETPEEAGVRETLEETGFVIERGALVKIDVHFTSTGCSTEKHHSFLASVTKDTPRQKPKGDGSERITTLEMSFEEAFLWQDEHGTEHATLNALLRAVRIQVLELENTEMRQRLDEIAK